MIGDGFTDYEVMTSDAAHLFYAFTENVRRESVVKNADGVFKSFDDLVAIL